MPVPTTYLWFTSPTVVPSEEAEPPIDRSLQCRARSATASGSSWPNGVEKLIDRY